MMMAKVRRFIAIQLSLPSVVFTIGLYVRHIMIEAINGKLVI